MVDEALIAEIVRRVLSAVSPDKVILFGSAASGDMTPTSDIDLLVVEPDAADPRRRSIEIDRMMSGLGYTFDIVVMSSEWFEVSKDVVGGMAYPAHKYGRVIYEAA